MPSASPSPRSGVVVAVQVLGLVMVAAAAGLLWGFAWGLAVGGTGVLAVGVALEKTRTGEAASAG